MLFIINTLSIEQRAQIVSLLVEGNGINAITRIIGVAKNTVLKLLRNLGEACEAYHDKHVVGLTSRRIQADEIWSFCYAKKKNVPAQHQGEFGFGDVWTWTAIDADSKLMVSWHIGRRGAQDALIFMRDVASRLASRVQLTTDGHHAYLQAVDEAFQRDVDYAQLVKIYGEDVQEQQEHRYSPAKCLGMRREPVRGRPDPDHISTSFVEKHNQTMRQSMRRYTRLTAGHSKKVENHRYATALHFVHYNYARICQSIRCAPAMEAGISDHVWSIEEIISLLK
jgi:IS1 family transposase